MKIHEILLETITFNACSVDKRDDGTTHITPHNWRKVKEKCWVCKGTSKDKYDPKYDCDMCYGTGKIDNEACDGPQMRMSNMSAGEVIRDILDQEFDYSGMVEKTDMPKLRQKLIRMINVEKDREKLTRDPTDEQKTRVTRKDGVSTIGKGPQMIGFGRNDSQTKQLAAQLLKVVEYAAKHDLVLSWG